jgi:hypothetical protein
MPKASDTQLAVIYPIVEVRGRAADRVRTWTQGQTLPRESYRVVVAFDGTDPPQERDVLPLLGPGDELFSVPGAHDAELWNAGAARAGTTWLVITEGHCLARPGCLEAVTRWIAANPTADVGNFDVDHNDGYLIARISRRWFDMIHARWDAPGEWPRLHRAGFVIRADVFEASGGFEGAYGQFAIPLLAARLHARGIRIERVPGAAVLHHDDERMSGHHYDTADFARGELEARSRNGAVFFERYFGHAPIWSNRRREQPRVAGRMVRAIAAAMMVHPRRAADLASLLRPLVPAMFAGIAARVALHRLIIALDELAVERLPLPAKWRWSRFLRAHARVVRLAQLEWIRSRAAAPTLPLAPGRLPIEQLGPDTIVGVHALEEHLGRLFRWTEPVVQLHLAPFEREHELRIETGGIRGDPLAAVVAVVLDRRLLPKKMLSRDGDGTLVLRLPSCRRPAAGSDVIIVCAPLAPARTGSSDRRLLGLPVISIASVPAQAHTRVGSAAA